jgi:gamma-D-glutamyl-L-lysine dipeptidyl-peptidase
MNFVYVNVDSANLYKEASYRSAIVSQAVLWEKIELLEKAKQFSRIVCEDGYAGWISNHQVCAVSDLPDELKMVSKNRAGIYESPNLSAPVIREAGAGSYLPVIKLEGEWVSTVLPDGKSGWLFGDAFTEISGDRRESLLKLSLRFLGVPYYWGGKSAKGLDCSGFAQLLHKLVGISIRRDSPMQFEDTKFVSENPLDGQPGDLLFFTEEGNRITHVGVKLENEKIIHARGMIRINSLASDGKDFDKSLLDDFVAVKSFF